MRVGSRIGSVARDRATWVVLLALALGVALPAACVIWFMTEAASNQADAARQRLSDALQGQLRLLRERIDADWRSRLARLDSDEIGGAAAFSRAVVAGGLDSVVFPGRDGAAGYPSLSVAPLAAAAMEASPEWRTAATLDAYGSHAAAAQHYAAIAARQRNADRAARAAQAQVRALLLAGDQSSALRAIERHFTGTVLAAGRDRHGRLIAGDAQLLALRLTPSSDARFPSKVERLAALVNDYGVAMPSSQRLFLMSELRAAAPSVALPTYAAERLAIEFLEADGVAPAGEALAADPSPRCLEAGGQRWRYGAVSYGHRDVGGGPAAHRSECRRCDLLPRAAGTP